MRTNAGEHSLQGRMAEDHCGRVGCGPQRHEDDREVLAHLQVRPAQWKLPQGEWKSPHSEHCIHPHTPQKWLNILPITFFKVSELLSSTWSDMEQHRYGWHHRPSTPSKIFFFVTINNFLINMMIIIFQREFALNPSVDVPHPTDPVVGYKWVSLIMIIHQAVVMYILCIIYCRNTSLWSNWKHGRPEVNTKIQAIGASHCVYICMYLYLYLWSGNWSRTTSPASHWMWTRRKIMQRLNFGRERGWQS